MKLSLILASLLALKATSAWALPLEKIKLPPGFKIEVFAEVPKARSLAKSPGGTIFVGTRAESVYAVKDGKVYEIAQGLNSPNGVAFKDGDLYVAEIPRLLRYKNVEASLAKPPKPETLPVQFPSDEHHGWKFIAFGPDGHLYVPVGAPCNVCDRGADGYSAIFKVDKDFKTKTVFASGVRNTVGFAWHPATKAMYFTDNGRDLLGDDVPDDELNVAPKPGLDFGYPRCHAGKVKDPDFGKGADACKGSEKPVALLGPHVAALGLRFYQGAQFPATYKNRLFIAEHGSWNRSKPIGYQVVTVTLSGKGQGEVEKFATGWLDEKSGEAWGRPVDVLELGDGTLLVSDDKAGVIYKISYAKK